MKCVLASAPEVRGGKIRESVLVEIERLVGKSRDEIKVAIIADAAMSDDFSQHWLIEQLKSISDTFYKKVFFLNLMAYSKKQIEKRIDQVDVIWCCAGSTDFLMTIFKRSGFAKMLPKILKDKVWVGSSAGAVVLGRKGSEETQKALSPDDVWLDVKEYMSLVDACIYPHVYRDKEGKYVPENALELIVEESNRQKCPCYALAYKGALVIDGDRKYMIGENNKKILNGKEVIERAVRWGKELIVMTWIEDEVPKGMQVGQVYAVAFSKDGRILLKAEETKDGWFYSLPGGTPEKKDENLEATLRREFVEEVNTTLKENVCHLGYQEVMGDNGRAPYAQVRTVAVIDKIGEAKPDSDNGKTYKRVLVSPERAIELLDWKEIGKAIIKKAVEVAKLELDIKRFSKKEEEI